MRVGLAVAVASLAVPAHAGAQLSGPPDNDDRAVAHKINSPGYWGIVTGDATAEPGEETIPGGGGHSVWYRWTAPATGPATARVCGADFDTVAAVYPVDRAASTLATADDEAGCGEDGTGSVLRFAAEAGSTYLVEVDGKAAATGYIEDPAMDVTTRGNDDFADAALMPSLYYGEESAYSRAEGATAEAGEPAHGGRQAERTRWWRLTAPIDGRVTFSAACEAGPRDVTLGVYRGVSLDDLEQVYAGPGGCDHEGTVFLRAGQQVRIAVDIHDDRPGATVDITADTGGPFTPEPPDPVDPPADAESHDAFATPAQLVAGLPIHLSVDGATAEPGEPEHDGRRATRSVWARWTAPADERVVVEACTDVPLGLGGDIDKYEDALLAVYRGDALPTLDPVASSDDAASCPWGVQAGPSVAFDAREGTTYRVALDAFSKFFTRAVITLHEPPAGDDRAVPAALPAAGTSTAVDLTAATGGDAWFRVPAGPARAVRMSTCGTWVLDTTVTAYRLDGGSLQRIGGPRQRSGCTGNTVGGDVTLAAAAGEEYLVRVASADARRGIVRLDVADAPAVTPQTTFTGPVPRARTKATSVSVGLESDTPGASFECQVDGGDWASCPGRLAADGLAEGEHTLAARASAAGVTETTPARLSFVVDTTPPELEVSEPLDGTVTYQSGVTVTGRCGYEEGDRPYVTVETWAGATATGTPASQNGGNECDDGLDVGAPLLGHGTNTIRVSLTDEAGNISSVERRVERLVAQPKVTVNPMSGGAVKRDRRPEINGTAELDTAVIVTISRCPQYCDENPQTQTVNVVDGAWSARPLEELPDGNYAIEAHQVGDDAADGPVGRGSFAVDNEPPVVTILSPDEGSGAVRAWVHPGGMGQEGSRTIVTFRGPNGFEAVATYEDTSSPSLAGHGWQVAAPRLPIGDIEMVAEQTDPAGNVGRSETRHFTIDESPPEPTLDSPADGSVMTRGQARFSGTAGTARGDDSGVDVWIHYASGSWNGYYGKVVDGRWSVTLPEQFPEGAVEIFVEQGDWAFNRGASEHRSYTIAPAVGGSDPPPDPTPRTDTEPTAPAGQATTESTATTARMSPVPTDTTTTSSGPAGTTPDVAGGVAPPAQSAIAPARLRIDSPHGVRATGRSQPALARVTCPAACTLRYHAMVPTRTGRRRLGQHERSASPGRSMTLRVALPRDVRPGRGTIALTIRLADGQVRTRTLSFVLRTQRS